MLPPLAQYTSITKYEPKYGDMIIWTGWFSTWIGYIIKYDKDDTISVVFSSIPFLLLTMTPYEQKKETKELSLSKVKNSYRGKYAIQHHDIKTNSNIWYI